jgi:hypothetical protein
VHQPRAARRANIRTSCVSALELPSRSGGDTTSPIGLAACLELECLALRTCADTGPSAGTGDDPEVWRLKGLAGRWCDMVGDHEPNPQAVARLADRRERREQVVHRKNVPARDALNV